MKSIDWDDPKWSNPRVHVSTTGSFLTADEPQQEAS